MSEFELSSSLVGHTQDVRTLSVTPSSSIISGSRDASAIVWRSGDGNTYTASRTIANPDGKFVASVGWLEHDGVVYIALGSQSSVISLWRADDENATGPAFTLVGHKQNVCCLDSNSGTLISGSWDKTAIIWRDMKQVVRLQKHQQAVWAVRCVGTDRFLTGSADRLISLFDISGQVLRTFSGHSDCVRSLSVRTDGVEGFWSASNDGNVMLWSMTSTAPIATMSGHTSFVYAVTALPNGEGAVSSGEDGCVRVWKDGQAVQTIVHPSTSVWCVEALSNGDIVSGSSDGIVRVWSRDPSRVASIEDREAYQKAVAARQINKSQIGDVNKTDLPGLEALKKSGKSEGQVIMIKNKDVVEAYQWQSAHSKWQQIGEVVDAVGSNRKQLYEGREYDYVFDVDISEGQPPLKLPFNANENPWSAAERFLNKHELPLGYTDQVVAFIEKNTAGVQLGTTYSDPYTGSSRYQSSAPTQTANVYRDPLTGGSAYSTASTGKSPSKSILPVKTPPLFKQINVVAVKNKVNELNNALKNDASAASHAMSPKEERNLGEILAQLGSPAVAQPDVNASSPAERYDPAVFLDSLSKWPEDKRFPLIDLCRALTVCSPSISKYESPSGSVIEALLRDCEWEGEWQASKARETNTMLAMRAIANLVGTRNGKQLLGSDRIGELLSDLASRHPFDGFNKNIRVALATIALNCSILAVDGTYPVSQSRALLQFVSNILSSESEDGEVAYRTIVAFGNMLSASGFAGSLPVGDVEVAKELALGLANRIGEPRLKDIISEVEAF